jgi:hypothetical protein
MAKNIVEAQPPVFHFSNRYCHPADGVFETNILQFHAICPSFFAEVAR